MPAPDGSGWQARTYFEMYHCFRLQPLTKITTDKGLETAIDLLEFALFLGAQVCLTALGSTPV